jgi:TRAP-type C4-dicarboxylate transport system permease small subunit
MSAPLATGFEAAARAVRVMTALYLGLAGVLFVLGLALYATEIMLRYVFDTGLPEYYEIVGIGFIYVFLFGAAALYGRSEDIVIDLLYTRLPPPAQRWLAFAVHLAVAATMLLVAVQGWRLAAAQWNIPTPLLEVSEGIKVIPLVLAAASIAFASATEAWACLIWIATGTRHQIWTRPFFDQSIEQGEI